MAAALLALVASSIPAPDLLAAPLVAPPTEATTGTAADPAAPTSLDQLALGTTALESLALLAPPIDLPEPAPVAPSPTAPAVAAAAGAAFDDTVGIRSAVVSAAARPAALWRQLRDGLTVTGRATWYDATRGYADVAHVAMPGARYLPRGRTAPRARVCAGDVCRILPVVDYCGCHVGTDRARLVDLSAGALRSLGLDPRDGIYRVRVTLVAG